MPNRSMLRRALALSRAGYQRGRGGYDGVYGAVTFVAVFPDTAFGSDVPSGFEPAAVAPEAAAIMPTGMRPVTPRVWWKPDDPAEPGSTGVAVVRLDDYGYDEDLVYVHRVQPDDSVDVFTVWDKPHRVRWAEDQPETVISRDPAVIRATRLMFDIIHESNGFLPDMSGWLHGTYGGRWYTAVEWDPYDGYGVLRETVRRMDEFRREYGADVRLYGTHVYTWRDGVGRVFASRSGNEPRAVLSGDASLFAKAMRAYWASPRDEETWRLYSREP